MSALPITESNAAHTLEGHEFASLLNKEFKPKTDQARDAVEAAVQTLAQQALASVQRLTSGLSAADRRTAREAADAFTAPAA